MRYRNKICGRYSTRTAHRHTGNTMCVLRILPPYYASAILYMFRIFCSSPARRQWIGVVATSGLRIIIYIKSPETHFRVSLMCLFLCCAFDGSLPVVHHRLLYSVAVCDEDLLLFCEGKKTNKQKKRFFAVQFMDEQYGKRWVDLSLANAVARPTFQHFYARMIIKCAVFSIYYSSCNKKVEQFISVQWKIGGNAPAYAHTNFNKINWDNLI